MNYYHSDTPDDELDRIIHDAYILVHLCYRNLVKIEVVNDSLAHHHLAIMALLSHHDLLPIAEVAKQLSISKPHMTQFIERLSHNGLISRVPDTNDKRRVLVSLTEEGRQTFNEYRARVKSHLSSRFANLPDEEIHTLAGALQTIIAITSKIEQGSRFETQIADKNG